MTHKPNIELTRRRVLAGLGAIGVASAGPGIGTGALFSDEERFANNTLAAGNLDLKVDWEEHYAFPQIYGFDDPTDGLEHDVRRSDPDDVAYVGLPDPVNPVVWVHEEDLDAYMANTAIEAFPDPNDDGSQEVEYEGFVYDPCEDGADVDTHLDPTIDAVARRTENSDTYDAEEESVAPLVNLTDVKPGDFGELTLSFHLCDNPGHVWLRADNVSEAENGLAEPESEVDDTENDAELAENIETVWWYDTNGDNVINAPIGAVDAMLAIDTSGSLDDGDADTLAAAANELSDQLIASGDARVGGLSFGDSAVEDFMPLSSTGVEFDNLGENGNTPFPAALEVAAEELDENGRSEAATFIVVFTDGGPNYPNDGYDEFPIGGGFTPGPYQHGDPSNSIVEDAELEETYEIANDIRDDHRILTVGVADDRPVTNNADAEVNGTEIDTLRQYLRDFIAGGAADYFSVEDPGDVEDQVLDAILDAIAMSEQVFHRGTLDQALELLSTDAGIPLDANLASDFDEIVGGEPADGDDDDRECYQPGVTNYVGFGWWLPADVGNEVQTDSVSFDLGFYTEQCRHNE